MSTPGIIFRAWVDNNQQIVSGCNYLLLVFYNGYFCITLSILFPHPGNLFMLTHFILIVLNSTHFHFSKLLYDKVFFNPRHALYFFVYECAKLFPDF
jgi:hypothetical protein